ncbi:MAG: hypothetical protein ACI4WT_12625 [Oligosphaeraceae bacterium]
MPTLLLTALLLLLPLCAHAQSLVKVRPLRHDTAEIRATLTDATAPFHLRCVASGTGDLLADLAADDSRPPRTLTVTVQEPDGPQCHQLPWPQDDLRPGQTLLLRRHGSVLDLATSQRLIARFPATRSFKGDLLAAADRDGNTCIATPHYQRLLPITFGDDFMRTEEEAKNWGLWNPIAGTWRIHSVMERIQDNPSANIRPGKIPSADRSPNPFTLDGHADGDAQEALIVTGQNYWHDYTAAVTMRPRHATAGLVFAYRDRDNHWRTTWTLTSTGTKDAPLQLIQRRDGKDIVQAQTILPGRADNWWRLAVQLRGTAITVLLDGSPVLTHSSDQCPEGLVGLYTRGTVPTAFDDVSVTSTHLTAFTTRTAAHDGWRPLDDARLQATAPNATRTFGGNTWPVQRCRTTLTHRQPHQPVGLACGPDARFLAACDSNGTTRRLILLDRARNAILQQLELPHAATTRLLLDTTQPHTIEVRDGETLVLRHSAPDLPDLKGPIALVALDAQAVASLPDFFVELNRDWEQPVNIERFANDPFMQGWASSRYVWTRLAPTAKSLPATFLFTGDIYGAFSLKTPLLNQLRYRFGSDVPDDENGYELKTDLHPDQGTATLTLSRAQRTLATATLTGLKLSVLPGTQIIDEKIGARPRTPDTRSWGTVTLHRDGHLLWLEHQGQTILSALDPKPLTGRACTVTLPETIDFIHVDLRREHVRDYLFERSEHDWTALGTWEVTNRFACDPRWSHMNGESFGTAALWSKFALDGDFTIECFAGMRMRQGDLKENARMSYPRVGDINLAFQADGHNLFSGYNLIIAAWDPQWSETWTQLRRHGDILAQTDRELIPRGRLHAPKTRPIALEWDPGSRPVHGAWYALKLRRTGPRLEAWFDNQKILDVTDPDPLTAHRRLALWTQHNSIVLARVKVNYTRIANVPPQPDTHSAPLAERLAAQTVMPAASHQTTGDAPHDWQRHLIPRNGDQSPDIHTFPSSSPLASAVLLENVNAGGDFAVRLDIENRNELLDTTWLEFDCAFSPDARFNLYLEPSDPIIERAFVTITGPDHSAPNLLRLGKATLTPIPGKTTAGQPWHHVAIPLAALARNALPFLENPGLDRLEIGMLHEGYLNAGLDGNHRGAWLIIDHGSLTTITPQQHDALPQDEQFHLRPLHPQPNQSWNLGSISVAFAGHDALLPRLTGMTLTANGQRVTLSPLNAALNGRTLTISHAFTPFTTPDVTFTLSGRHPVSQLPWQHQWTATLDPTADATPPTIPTVSPNHTRLASLDPHTDDILSHTSQSPDTYFDLAPRTDIPSLPAVTVTTRCPGSKNTLKVNHKGLDIRRVPYLFADLQLSPEALIGLTVQTATGNAHTALNSPDLPTGTTNLQLPADGRWHTAQFSLEPTDSDNVMLKAITFGAHTYSGAAPGTRYAVSNLRFAPCVSATPTRPLTLHWTSHDTGGIDRYAWSWSASPQDTPNHEPTQSALAFDSLPDGLQFLHLRAQDRNGNWSPTAHLPYLIDNALPTAAPDAPSAAPTTLTATISENCRQLITDKATLALTLNGQTTKTRFSPRDLTYDDQTRHLSLNICAAAGVFGQPLNSNSEFSATLSGLTNRADTPLPPLTWSWTLDHRADTTPPPPPVVGLPGLVKPLAQPLLHFEGNAPRRPLAPKNISSILLDDLSQSHCLQISSPAGQPCLIPLTLQPINLDKIRFLRFRCRLLTPTTRINLYLGTPAGLKSIILNGPEDKPAIAACNTITPDGQWHTALIDLQHEVFDKLKDELKNKTIWRLSIGRADKPDAPLDFRLDDIAFVPTVPPALLVHLNARDPSGISAGACCVHPADQDGNPPPPDHRPLDCPYAITSYPLSPILFPSQGLCFILTTVRDGAGNLSSPLSIPLHCTGAPTTPTRRQDTDLTQRDWLVLDHRRDDKPARNVHRLQLHQGDAHPLLLHASARKAKQELLLVTRTDGLPTSRLAHGLQAELLNIGAGTVSLQPVLLDHQRRIIARGPTTTTLKPTQAWQPSTAFRNKAEPDAQPPAFIGFLVSPQPRHPFVLLLNNITLAN